MIGGPPDSRPGAAGAAGRAARFSGELRELADLALEVAETCSAAIEAYASAACETLEGGGKLLFCGNGGSAADAQHLAAECVVRLHTARRPLPAIALTTDTSVLTACANDLGYDEVFARQAEALASRGDLLVLHSSSGNSPNLLRAAQAAEAAGVRTVGVLARGGGKLRPLVDIAVVVPTDHVSHAQEIQLAIGHIVCRHVEATLFEDRAQTAAGGEA